MAFLHFQLLPLLDLQGKP